MFVIFLLAGERNNFVDQIASVVISFFVAVVSYYIIENPIRQSSYWKGNLRRIFTLGLSLLLISGIVFGGAIYFKTKALESISNQPQKEVVIDKTEAEIIKKVKEGLEIKTLPVEIESTIEATIKDGKNRDCIAGHTESISEVNKKCNFGSGELKIALIGDSHAR